MSVENFISILAQAIGSSEREIKQNMASPVVLKSLIEYRSKNPQPIILEKSE